MPKLHHELDISAVVRVLKDSDDDDTARHEAAELLHRSDYSALTDDLIEVLNNPKEGPRFRSFAVQHLWLNTDEASPDELEKITIALRQTLTDRHVKVRREALLALHRRKDPVADETALKWLHEPAASDVRDIAIRVIREKNLRGELPTIRGLAQDQNTIIRIAAIVTLSQWGDEESRPAFEVAAKSSNVRLQRAGKAALKRLEQPHQAKPQPRPEPVRKTVPGDRF